SLLPLPPLFSIITWPIKFHPLLPSQISSVHPHFPSTHSRCQIMEQINFSYKFGEKQGAAVEELEAAKSDKPVTAYPPADLGYVYPPPAPQHQYFGHPPAAPAGYGYYPPPPPDSYVMCTRLGTVSHRFSQPAGMFTCRWLCRSRRNNRRRTSFGGQSRG
ncbi:unnamed protein product, partial [Linum tenue]